MSSIPSRFPRQAAEVVEFSRLVYQRRLVSAAGGNISTRCGDGLLITPSGKSLRNVSEEDLLWCDLEGQVIEGPDNVKPSKEMPFHAAVYRNRPEVNSVIHGHPVYSTIASGICQRLTLYTESARLKLQEVPVIEQAPPGSPQLAELIRKAVAQEHSGLMAYLLAEHGILTLGETMEACFDTAELLEDSARIAVFRRLLGQEIPS